MLDQGPSDDFNLPFSPGDLQGPHCYCDIFWETQFHPQQPLLCRLPFLLSASNNAPASAHKHFLRIRSIINRPKLRRSQGSSELILPQGLLTLAEKLNYSFHSLLGRGQGSPTPRSLPEPLLTPHCA